MFGTTLVDDDPDENLDEPPPHGRRALGAIRDLLLQRGKTVSSIEQHPFYGWSIEVDGHRALIQGDNESLLLIVHGRDAEALVAAIADVIASDPRFSDIQVTTELGSRSIANARVVRR